MLKKKIPLFLVLMMLSLVFFGTLGYCKTKKELTIVTYANWNPFEYLDKGNLVGFDVDLIKTLAKEAGYDCKIQNVGWDAVFTQLQNGNADLAISGITITDVRKQSYQFSKPYFISEQSMVVRANSGIKSAANLKNKQIAVQSGSTGQEAVEKILGKNNPNIKKIKNGLTYLELLNNDVDVVVGDDTSNKKYLKSNPNQKLVIVRDKKSFEPEYFGIMYPKQSTLKTVFDKEILKSVNNGTYAKIYRKWFGVKPDIAELKAAH